MLAVLAKRLLEAHELVKHGEWEEWLVANTKVHPTTARRWMRIAKQELEGKAQAAVRLILEEMPIGEDDDEDVAPLEAISSERSIVPQVGTQIVQTKIEVKTPAAVADLPLGVPGPRVDEAPIGVAKTETVLQTFRRLVSERQQAEKEAREIAKSLKAAQERAAECDNTAINFVKEHKLDLLVIDESGFFTDSEGHYWKVENILKVVNSRNVDAFCQRAHASGHIISGYGQGKRMAIKYMIDRVDR